MRRENSRYGGGRSTRSTYSNPISRSGSSFNNFEPSLHSLSPARRAITGPRPKRDPNVKLTKLTDEERPTWHCSHCWMDAYHTSIVRRGPQGIKTLCNSCGSAYITRGNLPPGRKD